MVLWPKSELFRACHKRKEKSTCTNKNHFKNCFLASFDANGRDRVSKLWYMATISIYFMSRSFQDAMGKILTFRKLTRQKIGNIMVSSEKNIFFSAKPVVYCVSSTRSRRQKIILVKVPLQPLFGCTWPNNDCWQLFSDGSWGRQWFWRKASAPGRHTISYHRKDSSRTRGPHLDLKEENVWYLWAFFCNF